MVGLSVIVLFALSALCGSYLCFTDNTRGDLKKKRNVVAGAWFGFLISGAIVFFLNMMI